MFDLWVHIQVRASSATDFPSIASHRIGAMPGEGPHVMQGPKDPFFSIDGTHNAAIQKIPVQIVKMNDICFYHQRMIQYFK